MTRTSEGLRQERQSGQSLVELALITPLILVALYIPADFGMAFFTAHFTQIAVREGARIGSGLSSGDVYGPIKSPQGVVIKDAVFSRLPARLQSPSVNVRFYFSDASATCAQVVEVTASGTYDYFWYRMMGIIGVAVSPSANITRTTQMRYNYQRPENSSILCALSFNQTYTS
jgi:hypothetical protein